jgi:5'-3' exonuclease
LCGCDYTTNIPGVGPVKAFKFLQEEGGTIENVIARIEKESNDPKKKSKYTIPDTFYYKEARKLFENPDAIIDKQFLES